MRLGVCCYRPFRETARIEPLGERAGVTRREDDIDIGGENRSGWDHARSLLCSSLFVPRFFRALAWDLSQTRGTRRRGAWLGPA